MEIVADDADEDNGVESRRGRWNQCCKSLVTHACSNTGLLCLVIAYSLLGAVLFEFLEADYEMQRRGQIQRSREDCLKELWLITGTGWAQELAWLILNNLDFETAKKSNFLYRNPVLDFSVLYEYDSEKLGFLDGPFDNFSNSFEFCDNLPSPRYLKIHTSWEMLPKQIKDGRKKPKIIYMARNPKDVCVSYYSLSTLKLDDFKGTLDDFCEMFLNDRVLCSPYWEHVNEFWKRRNDPNICYMRHRDLVENINGVITKLCTFLDKELSNEDFTKLEEFMVDFIKSNPSTNSRILLKLLKQDDDQHLRESKRRDQVNSHVTEMSMEYIKKFDKWIEENLVKYNLPIDCF